MKAILRLSKKLYALACAEVFTESGPKETLIKFLSAIEDADVELMADMLDLYGDKRIQKWVTNIRKRAVNNTPRTSTSIKISFG